MNKHSEGKEATRNALPDEAAFYYDGCFGPQRHLPPVSDLIDGSMIMTMRMADLMDQDGHIATVGQLLTIEQFRGDRAWRLAVRQFRIGLTEYAHRSSPG